MAGFEVAPDEKLSSLSSRWDDGSRSFEVHIEPAVLDRLASEAWAAYKRIPRRGLEIGGILEGRVATSADRTAYLIDGFRLIGSEYRLGPAYVLSPGDLTKLQAALDTLGPAGVGIFRSQTRSDSLDADGADANVFNLSFGQRDALFFMLVPATAKAGFFAMQDGQLRCVYEISLASQLAHLKRIEELVQKQAPAAAPRVGPTPQVEPMMAAVTESGVSKPRGGIGSRAATWLLAAAALVFVLSALLFWQRRAKSAPPVVVTHTEAPRYVQLNVKRTGTSLQLSWDLNSPALRDATRSVVHIQDGGAASDRSLTAAELKTGSLTYLAKNAQVSFRMDVFAAEPSAVGAVQVQLPASAPPVMLPASPAPAPTPPQGTHQQLASPAMPVPSRPAVEPKFISPIPEPLASKPNVDNREALDKIETPWRVASRAKHLDSQSGPSVQVAVEPVTQSRVGRMVGKVPILRRFAKPQTAAPVPVFQPQPFANLAPGEVLEHPIAIDVKVYVGESGSVKSAEVMEYGNPPNMTLANAALNAARRWRFEPARDDDEVAIPSEAVLRFRFNP